MFPLFFFIQDERAQINISPRIFEFFDVDVNLLEIDTQGKVIPKKIQVEPCGNKLLNWLTNIETTTTSQVQVATFCPVFDDEILLNGFFNPNSYMLRMEFFKCDPSERECASDLEDIFESIIIVSTTLDTIVNSNDYEDPIKEILHSETNLVSKAFNKYIDIEIVANKFSSDNGWLIENINSIDHLTVGKKEYDYKYNDFNSDSNTGKVKMPALSTIFFAGQIIEELDRSYLKVQELFAKIGGILNALNIAVYIVFYHPLRFKYIMAIRNHLVEEIEKVEKNYNDPLNLKAHNNQVFTNKEISEEAANTNKSNLIGKILKRKKMEQVDNVLNPSKKNTIRKQIQEQFAKDSYNLDIVNNKDCFDNSQGVCVNNPVIREELSKGVFVVKDRMQSPEERFNKKNSSNISGIENEEEQSKNAQIDNSKNILLLKNNIQNNMILNVTEKKEENVLQINKEVMHLENEDAEINRSHIKPFGISKVPVLNCNQKVSDLFNSELVKSLKSIPFEKENYFSYVFSFVTCSNEKKNLYSNMYKSVEMIISVQSYWAEALWG
eukprot:CAMPEP_0170519404 /NCGR_PEP_ID=MMETSP0209-20121228/4835_1 /TAXON_ID=665100 ORGANISM="Litonotus pictus, Strain P1" /NCGR_SAMPLE_ID=MMETSP0209 /ASSEMBLY_ACC=CAM_ASM_000301 /LENGTH=551 /DNA_ID=CAMNT_0010805279 /DNA_START=220 /DNA_END=1871 /DNA_ORIENTATION=-